MADAADNGNSEVFYEALVKFTIVSLSEANNPILSNIMLELLPNVKRMQYLSILLKTDKLKENIKFFKTIIGCLESREIEKGVAAMHDYVAAEKDFVLSVIDDSKYAHYIED